MEKLNSLHSSNQYFQSDGFQSEWRCVMQFGHAHTIQQQTLSQPMSMSCVLFKMMRV